MKIRDITLVEPELPAADLADFTALYLKFLTLHHGNEDRYLFPALHAATALRSSDVAVLDQFSKEHELVHHFIEGIERTLPAIARDATGARRELGSRIADLYDLLTPHLDTEEAMLTPEHLAAMIPEPELDRCEHEMVEEDKARGGRPVLMLLVHSLGAEERRSLLGPLPWFVRRVLIDGLWKRSYARFLPFRTAS